MSTVLEKPGRRQAGRAPSGERAQKQPREKRPPRPQRAPRPKRPYTQGEETLAVFSSAFTMITIVCLWMAAQLLFLGNLSQDRAQGLLYTELRTQLASLTAPTGPIVPVGDPVAVISAPRIGLQQVVVEGTASGDLLAGPGHRRDTPLPGQEGISLVYGRGTSYGAPFGDITQLVKGDHIEVVMAQGRITFTVLDVRRTNDPIPPPPAAGEARLTLVTAEGAGWLGKYVSAGSAVYVDAEAKKAFPAPAGRPGAVPESEKAMANDKGALPLLALALGCLVALTLGVIAARQRWSTALVWVIASPLAVALAWATTDVVMRLLPNLI
jgi:sortase A